MANVEQYLRRIGLVRKEAPTHSYLVTLQRQHLLNVPFENLSVIWNEPILLLTSALFDKIVTKGRGGFCYELNGLFAWLLQELGYSVIMVSARVFNATKQDFGPDFDHMALLVQLDKTYLVDVGFGDSFRIPIRLPDGSVEDASGIYRLAGTSQSGFIVQKWNDPRWEPQYCFSSAARKFSDYHEMCAYHQTSPESSFTQRRVCTIATGNGRMTLTQNSFTITEGLEKTKWDVPSEEQFQSLLREHFGIWP